MSTTGTETLEAHEAANIFPLDNRGQRFHDLVNDIRKHGQRVPIELYEGKILDGRRRYLACREAGVEPKFRDVTGEVAEPTAYVVSLNVRRRHLTKSQAAMAVIKAHRLQDRLWRQAKQKMSEGGKAGGRASGASRSGGPKGEEKLPHPSSREPQTRDKLGAEAGVSGKLVDAAAKVFRHGTPELVEQVEQGKVTVTAAAKTVSTPKRPKARGDGRPTREGPARAGEASLMEVFAWAAGRESVRLTDLTGQFGQGAIHAGFYSNALRALSEVRGYDVVRLEDGSYKVTRQKRGLTVKESAAVGRAVNRGIDALDKLPVEKSDPVRIGCFRAFLELIDCLSRTLPDGPSQVQALLHVKEWLGMQVEVFGAKARDEGQPTPA